MVPGQSNPHATHGKDKEFDADEGSLKDEVWCVQGHGEVLGVGGASVSDGSGVLKKDTHLNQFGVDLLPCSPPLWDVHMA